MNFPGKRLQVDEIWSFTYAKQKNVAEVKDAPGRWRHVDVDGDLRRYEARPSWLVGGRDGEYAVAFIDDLSRRLSNRVQVTSAGQEAYLGFVEGAFGGDVDYAQI